MKSYHSILLFLLVLSYESIQLMDVSSPSSFSKPFFFFLFFFSKPIALHHSCCFLVGLTHFEALECLGKKKKKSWQGIVIRVMLRNIFLYLLGHNTALKIGLLGTMSKSIKYLSLFSLIIIGFRWNDSSWSDKGYSSLEVMRSSREILISREELLGHNAPSCDHSN